jgi:aerobic-type carbon monoxide dehydrogenase small subunit (CoxS/CutS family)
VNIDGKIAYACLTLAMNAQGKKITTIEGLSDGEELHPVQQAFIDSDAMQCGFCTPGFIMAMASVFDDNPNASLIEVKQGIAGNICRCGTYKQINEAAQSLVKK